MAGTRLFVCCALGALVIAALLMPPIAAPRAEDPIRSSPSQWRRNPPERPCHAEEEIGPNMPNNRRSRSATISSLSHRHDPAVAGGRAAKARRASRLQAPAGLRPQQAADGRCCRSGQGSLTDEAKHKVYDDAIKQMAARRRCTPATSSSDRGRSQGRDRGTQEGRGFRHARQGEVEDPAGEGRRSRLFHQGADGAGILRGRLQARQGPDLRTGEDPVRLARHQGRGQAHQPTPTFDRSGTRSTIISSAGRRPNWSRSCAATPRSSASTSRRRRARRSIPQPRRRNKRGIGPGLPPAGLTGQSIAPNRTLHRRHGIAG